MMLVIHHYQNHPRAVLQEELPRWSGDCLKGSCPCRCRRRKNLIEEPGDESSIVIALHYRWALLVHLIFYCGLTWRSQVYSHLSFFDPAMWRRINDLILNCYFFISLPVCAASAVHPSSSRPVISCHTNHAGMAGDQRILLLLLLRLLVLLVLLLLLLLMLLLLVLLLLLLLLSLSLSLSLWLWLWLLLLLLLLSLFIA